MKKYLHAFVLLTAISISSIAQSFTVNGPRTVNELPANKGTNKFTFFNLDSGREVAPADSNSTKWDIGFSKTTVIINGGTSGPASLSAQVIAATSFNGLTTAPTTGYVSDGTSKAISGWYTYNYVPADNGPHSITMNANKIIAVKLADGRYAKIQILNYYKGVPENIPTTGSVYGGVGAYITFRYLISEDASTDVSSNVTEVKSLYAAGKNYQFFNFTSADTVAVSDSATVKWDVAFKGTTILVNGGGASGVSTVNAQVISSTSFDGLTTAPTSGYAADASPLKAIRTGSGNGWYSYNSINNGPPHTITPIAGRIIVLKLADGRYVKLQILNYYKGAPENVPVSGSVEYNGIGSYYTFRYTISEPGSIDITTDVDDEPIATAVLTASAKTISIYPNPISTVGADLTIGSDMNTGTVKIMDLVGNQVYTAAITHSNMQLTNLNLAQGIYLVVLESDGMLYQQKLVVK